MNIHMLPMVKSESFPFTRWEAYHSQPNTPHKVQFLSFNKVLGLQGEAKGVTVWQLVCAHTDVQHRGLYQRNNVLVLSLFW